MLTDTQVRECAAALLAAGETFEAGGCDMPLTEQLQVCRYLEAHGQPGYRPDMVEGLMAEIEARDPPPKAIVLPPSLWYLLRRQIRPHLIWLFDPVTDDCTINCVPIRRKPLSKDCPTCGAPHEPLVCSYCRRPSDEIEIVEAPRGVNVSDLFPT